MWSGSALVVCLFLLVWSCHAQSTLHTFDCLNDACDDQEILCPDGDSCHIRCHGFRACQRLTIVAGDGSTVQFDCDDTMNCVGLDIQCADAESCLGTCVGFNSCQGAQVDCGSRTHAENVCDIDCQSRFACITRLVPCDYCTCEGVCGEITQSGEDEGLHVKTNFMNALSLRGFDVVNVLLHPSHIQFYIPDRTKNSPDLEDPDSVSAFMEGVSEALVFDAPPNPELSWIHENVLAYQMEAEYMNNIMFVSFSNIISLNGIPVQLTSAMYESNITLVGIVSEEAVSQWQLLSTILSVKMSEYFAVFFNLPPELVVATSEIVDDIATFNVDIPKDNGCSIPQPFYGVVCVAEDPPVWKSSNVDEAINFPDLFTGDTTTVADGSIDVEFGITLNFGQLSVTEVLLVSNSSISIGDSSLQAKELDLHGSILSSSRSLINVTGHLSVDSSSIVEFDASGADSQPIVIGGCADLDGELHITAGSEDLKDVPVMSFDCYRGEYKEVIVDDRSDPCLHVIPTYKSQLLMLSVFSDCDYVASSSTRVGALAPLLVYVCVLVVAMRRVL